MILMLIAIGLETGAAVGEAPAAADEDEPDKVEGGDDPGGNDGEPVVTALGIECVDREHEDTEVEGGEAKGEEKFGPAPQAGLFFVTNAAEDEVDLQRDVDEPQHGKAALVIGG
jgi:hypothetical protein